MRRKPSWVWIVGAVLLLIAGMWFAWPGAEPANAWTPRLRSAESLAADTELSLGMPKEVPTSTERTEVPGPVAASSTTASPGSLRIELSYPNGDPGVDLVVEVAPQGLTFDEASPRRQTFRSDGTGLVLCEGLAAGGYSVTVIQPLDGGKTATVRAGEETVLPIRFQPGCLVSGEVVDRNGRPVTGAGIWTLSGGHSQQAVAHSDESGRFVLRDAWRYLQLGATKAGHAPSIKKTVRGQPGEKLSVRLVLQGEGGAVRGLVVKPDGEPLAGAVVVFPNTGLPWTFRGETRLPADVQEVRAKTDEAGRFLAAGLPPLKIKVLARAAGYGAVGREVEVSAGRITEILLRLSGTAALHGRVLDAAGAGIGGAKIYASSELAGLMRLTRADDDGNYRLTGLTPGAVGLQIGWGQKLIFEDLELAEGENREHDIRAALTGVIRGRLLDDRDRPLVGWEILGQSAGYDFSQAKSREDGRFELAELVAADKYRLSFRRPKTESPPCHTIFGIVPGRAESVFRLPASAFQLGSIRGRLVDWQGRPAPKIWVRVRHLEFLPVEGLRRTDDGGFLVEDLPAGTYRIFVITSPQFRILPEITLGPGEKLDLGEQRLTQPATLSIDFDVPDGRRVESLAFFDERRRMCGTIDLAKGRLVDYPIAAGEYHVQPRGAGISSRLIPFEVKGGGHTRLRMALRGGHPCTLGFDFADQNFYMVREVDLTVTDAAGGVFLRESVPIPFRVSRHFPPGKYALKVTSRGGATVERRFEIADDAAKKNEFLFSLRR